MPPAAKLSALIVGIICLATPFSYAVPTVSTRGLGEVRRRLPSKPLFPISGCADDLYSFQEIHGSNFSFATTDNSIEKRDEKKTEYWAVRSGASHWKIKVTGSKYDDDALKTQESYWTGEIKRTGEILGEGAQGTVTEGTWCTYPEVFRGTISQEPEGGSHCITQPAAIKQSKGVNGYESAERIHSIESPSIVSVLGFGKEALPTLPDRERTFKSIVAYERLDTDLLDLMISNEPFDFPSLVKAVLRATLDARAHNIYNLDMKLENIMIDDLSKANSGGTWKVIDWDISLLGDSHDRHASYAGTLGYMAPEMLANARDRYALSFWTTGAAQVWTIGMIILYATTGEYRNRVTTEMKDFAKKITPRPPINPKDFVWYWYSLQLAYSKNENMFEALIPRHVQLDGDYEDVFELLRHVLCKEEDRWDLQRVVDFFFYI